MEEKKKKDLPIKCRQFGIWCQNTSKTTPFVGSMCSPCFKIAHHLNSKDRGKEEKEG